MELFHEYFLQHQCTVADASVQKSLDTLVETISTLATTGAGCVLTAGNGGSHATAEHFAADLSLMRVRISQQIRALCLNSQLI